MFTSTVDRRALTRVIAVTNGKGGVGKTSTCSHIGGLCALAGLRTLIIDLDPQGNVADDLGVDTDGGISILTSLASGQPPQPLRDVRPGLDLVPGGPLLHGAQGVLDGIESAAGAEAAVLRLAAVFAPLCAQYDAVWLDCPPILRKIMAAALAMAQFVVIPTKTDPSSIKGLGEVAGNFVAAREVNPGLELLGVVLFGVTPSARLVRAKARKSIETALKNSAPVFTATIRHVEAMAVAVRERGMLAYELEDNLADGAAGLRGLLGSDRHGARTLRRSASSLAGDYQALAEEVVPLFTKRAQEVEGL